jgi:hypothetical protein
VILQDTTIFIVWLYPPPLSCIFVMLNDGG